MKELLMNDRGTGRTTRMLELVVEQSKHETPLIIVVVHATHFVGYAMGVLRRLTDAQYVNHQRFEMVIGPTTVRFVADGDDLDDRLAGISRSVPRFYDHAVWQHRRAKYAAA
jgi:hypothetical protein